MRNPRLRRMNVRKPTIEHAFSVNCRCWQNISLFSVYFSREFLISPRVIISPRVLSFFPRDFTFTASSQSFRYCELVAILQTRGDVTTNSR